MHSLKSRVIGKLKPLKTWLEKAVLGSSLRYAYAFPLVESVTHQGTHESPLVEPPRILVLVDNVRATYFLFFHYVLKRLHSQNELGFFVLESAEIRRWADVKFGTAAQSSAPAFVQQVIDNVQPTLVIFSRYGLPYGDELLSLFRAQGIATICHIDDDLLNIKPGLGEEIQKRQGDPQVLRARRILLEQSDLIYASTAFLGDRLAVQFPQQKVLHSPHTPYLDFLLTAPQPKNTASFADLFSPNKSLTIGYMGSRGHQADLNSISQDIGRILTDYPQVRFETYGTIEMPAILKAFGNRIRSYRVNADYRAFLNKLQTLGWDIGLAPLEDNEFNRCKTQTKYIEYTTCGIATIASSGQVYREFGSAAAIVFAQSGEWYGKMQQLIENEPLRKQLVANGQAYCAQNFNLPQLENHMRALIALMVKT